MEDYEFREMLQLFPVVRSRNYRADSEASTQATSRSVQNEQVDEWQSAWDSESNKDIDINGTEEHGSTVCYTSEIVTSMGNLSANSYVAPLVRWILGEAKVGCCKKLGAAEADRFCKGFQHVHKKLVYEELSLDAAQRFLNSSKACGK